MNIYRGLPKFSYSLALLQPATESPFLVDPKRLESVLLFRVEALLASLPPNSILLLIPSKQLEGIVSSSSLTKWLAELQQLTELLSSTPSSNDGNLQ